MKKVKYRFTLSLLFICSVLIFPALKSNIDKKDKTSSELVRTNINGQGNKLTLNFTPGKYHNHPSMAVWLETMEGAFIQTLFVTQSIATGIFPKGEHEQGKWKHESGEVRRPAALPYFLHKRGIKAIDSTYLPTVEHPIPDAFTGATPIFAFNLETKTNHLLKNKFVVLFEVNQPWDWNEYWHNSLHPDDFNYKTSCQPALVYAATIDLNNKMDYYVLNPIGHSHYSGKDGKLYTDISTLTTAFQIFSRIQVVVE
jgi:hypothetical protein